MRNQLILLVMALSVSACAGQSKRPESPIPAETPLQVIAPQNAVEGPNAKTGGGTAGEDMLKGAGAGALYGAAGGAMAGVSCGPFLVICSPVMAVVGAGAGVVVGGVVGTVSGSLRGLPREKAEAFEAVVAELFESENPAMTVRDRFASEGSLYWQVASNEPSMRIYLTIDKITVEQDRKKNVKITLTTGMVMASGPELDEFSRRYRYVSGTGFRHIDTWLDDDGRLLREEIVRILEDSAEQMVASVRPLSSSRAARLTP